MAEREAPWGITRRSTGSGEPRQAARATTAAVRPTRTLGTNDAAAVRFGEPVQGESARRSGVRPEDGGLITLGIEVGLQDQRRCHGIDALFLTAGRRRQVEPGQLAARTHRRQALVPIRHRDSRPALQRLAEAAHLGGGGALITLRVEGESDHDDPDLVLIGDRDDLSVRRALAAPSHDGRERLGDGSCRIADGDANPPLAVIDAECPAHQLEPT